MHWWLPYFSVLQASYRLETATHDDGPVLASLHATGFARGWSEDEFDTFLSDPKSLCLLAKRTSPFGTGGLVGFALFRVVLDEAELLSIAVLPRRRGAGLGRALLQEGLRQLYARGVSQVFLDVAEDNAAAINLYRRCGFDILSKRKGYYPLPNGERATALVMSLDLR